MSNCPRCQTPIDEDFGLITCPGCGTTLFVELDGSLRANEEETEELDFPDPEEEIFEEDSRAVDSQVVDSQVVDSHLAATTDELWNQEDNHNNSETSGELPEMPSLDEHETLHEEPEPSLGVNESLIEEEESYEFLELTQIDESDIQSDTQNFEEEPGEGELSEGETSKSEWPEENGGEMVEPLVEEPPAEEVSTNFSDINEYGNSNISIAAEGVLRFNVYISGIDSSEILESIRESLWDKQFMWDIDELMESVQSGELELRDISAVKASIVVSRLKSIPIQIRWEQYAINQA